MKKLFTILVILALSTITTAQSSFDSLKSSKQLQNLTKESNKRFKELNKKSNIECSMESTSDSLVINGNISVEKYARPIEISETNMNFKSFYTIIHVMALESFDLATTKFTIEVYSDDNGKIGSKIASRSAVSDITELIGGSEEDELYSYLIGFNSLDFPILNKGKYWIAFSTEERVNDAIIMIYFNTESAPFYSMIKGDDDWILIDIEGYGGYMYLLAGECNLGTNDIFAKKALKVYPNPATSEVNIQLKDSKVVQVELTDMTGKVINVKATKEGKVDISSIAKGVYILTVKDDKGETFTQKIIKK